MRYSIVLFIVVLLTSTVSAEIPGRLDSLRAYVTLQMKITSDGNNNISEQTLNSAINRALNEVSVKTLNIEKLDTLYMTKDSEGVAFATDFSNTMGVRSVMFMSHDTVDIPFRIALESKSPDSLFPLRPSKEKSEHELANPLDPRYYWIFGKRLYVYPKWAKPYDTARYIVEYYARDGKIQDDDDIVTVDSDYREAIVMYACSIIEATRHDFTAADWYLQQYERLIAQ